MHVRLVKGAYAKTAGTHLYGEPTDVACLRLGFGLAEVGAASPMATHDARMREAFLLALGPIPVEQLLGVRPEVLDEPRDRDVPPGCTCLMAPTGSRYWLRRQVSRRLNLLPPPTDRFVAAEPARGLAMSRRDGPPSLNLAGLGGRIDAMLTPAYPICSERLVLRPFTPDGIDDACAYQSRGRLSLYPRSAAHP